MSNQHNYDNISIPENLSEIYDKACIRGKRKKMHDKIRTGMSVAAACLLLVLVSNVSPVYAALSDIPVIGSLVRVLHIGEGGVVADGRAVHNEAGEEGLKIWFSEENSYSADASHYEVEYKQAPERIVLTMNGVRNFDPLEFIEQANALSRVRAAYRETYLDDSAIRLVLELTEGTGYRVEEFKDPGYLQLVLEQKADTEEVQTLYYIRSRDMDMSEEAALLKEMLYEYGSDIVRTKQNRYFVTAGTYTDLNDAQQTMDMLIESGLSAEQFTVQSCKTNENPD